MALRELCVCFSYKLWTVRLDHWLTGVRFESWGVRWTSRWGRTAQCYRWLVTKAEEETKECRRVKASAAPTECSFEIKQVPAWSASRGASRGQCPSADDSSESPTQTSDSPKTCQPKQYNTSYWIMCYAIWPRCKAFFIKGLYFETNGFKLLMIYRSVIKHLKEQDSEKCHWCLSSSSGITWTLFPVSFSDNKCVSLCFKLFRTMSQTGGVLVGSWQYGKMLMLDFDECPKILEGVFTVPVTIPVLHFGG